MSQAPAPQPLLIRVRGLPARLLLHSVRVECHSENHIIGIWRWGVSITRGGDDVALTIDGANGNFSGSSSANISDGRLKKNIVGITSATATLKQLVGKTFNWIPESKLDTKTKYGFIAQEVKSVIPDLVYQDLSINRVSTASTAQDYGKGIIIDDNSADFSDDSKSEWSMSVETNGIVTILVEAFKELDARISALESS